MTFLLSRIILPGSLEKFRQQVFYLFAVDAPSAAVVFAALFLLRINAAGRKGTRSSTIAVVSIQMPLRLLMQSTTPVGLSAGIAPVTMLSTPLCL